MPAQSRRLRLLHGVLANLLGATLGLTAVPAGSAAGPTPRDPERIVD